MKKLICLLAALCLWVMPAAAAGIPLIPENAVPDIAAENAYSIPETGEHIAVTRSESGDIISVSGINDTWVPLSSPDAEAAQSLAAAVFPGAIVISSAECMLNGGAALRLNLMAETFCGHAVFADGLILAREITTGAYMKDGMLTPEGAKAAILLHRPGFKIDEIEKDNDDGVLLYEGEGYLSGVEYEFEMDAYTGRLLQWERD